MEFEKNTLLFGADSTPRIVAVELGETGTVRVHRRDLRRHRHRHRRHLTVPTLIGEGALGACHETRRGPHASRRVS